MTLLLDTHAFLWWLADSPRLAATARELVASERTIVYVSAASVWEIAIKGALGKLEMHPSDRRRLARLAGICGFVDLPVTATHAANVWSLPPHHGDPFDRVLIAQAQVEGLTIMTADPIFAAYKVARVEAG